MKKTKRFYVVFFGFLFILLLCLIIKNNKKYEGNENMSKIDTNEMKNEIESEKPQLSLNKKKYIKLDNDNGYTATALQSIRNQMKLMSSKT